MSILSWPGLFWKGVLDDLEELGDIWRHGWPESAIAPRAANGTDIRVRPERLLDAAVEIWRLKSSIETSAELRNSGAVRYALRKLSALLAELGIETEDLTGKPFDPGLAVEVVDKTPGGAPGASEFVTETLAPICWMNGKVARQGKVVIGALPAAQVRGENL